MLLIVNTCMTTCTHRDFFAYFTESVKKKKKRSFYFINKMIYLKTKQIMERIMFVDIEKLFLPI